MSNAFTQTGAKAFADKSINWVSDTIKAILLDASFVPTYDSATPYPNINNASFLSDISSAQVGSAVTLAGKSDAAGVLVASDLVFPGVSGNVVVRVAVYLDTGTPATSTVILAYDTADGLPITPNGGNINFFWDSGPFRVAQI